MHYIQTAAGLAALCHQTADPELAAILGLLSEHRDGSDRLFVKTPLWQAALKLETDDFLTPATRH